MQQGKLKNQYHTLRKISQLRLTSWCGNFAERHGFRSARLFLVVEIQVH